MSRHFFVLCFTSGPVQLDVLPRRNNCPLTFLHQSRRSVGRDTTFFGSTRAPKWLSFIALGRQKDAKVWFSSSEGFWIPRLAYLQTFHVPSDSFINISNISKECENMGKFKWKESTFRNRLVKCIPNRNHERTINQRQKKVPTHRNSIFPALEYDLHKNPNTPTSLPKKPNNYYSAMSKISEQKISSNGQVATQEKENNARKCTASSKKTNVKKGKRFDDSFSQPEEWPSFSKLELLALVTLWTMLFLNGSRYCSRCYSAHSSALFLGLGKGCVEVLLRWSINQWWGRDAAWY